MPELFYQEMFYEGNNARATYQLYTDGQERVTAQTFDQKTGNLKEWEGPVEQYILQIGNGLKALRRTRIETLYALKHSGKAVA